MKVIPPLTITPAMLAYSSVSDLSAGEVAWAAGTAYTVGQRAALTTTRRVYERLVAGTTATSPELDPINWRDAGPTNKWAMFDLERSSQTVSTGAPLVVQITPGRRITAVGLVGLAGATVRIEQVAGSTTLYDRTFNLLLRNSTTYSQYFFGSFRVQASLARFDLPLASGATITITITPTAGEARCGGVVIGMAEDLGTIIDPPVSDVQNFSKVTRDDFGVATLVKRRNVPLLQHRVRAEVGRLDRLRALREDLDAVPALWSGVDDRDASPFFDTLLLVGLAKKWSISLSGPLAVVSDLQLEEI